MADETKETKETKKEEGDKSGKAKKRPLVLWIAIGGMVLSVLGGGATFFLKGGSSEKKAAAAEGEKSPPEEGEHQRGENAAKPLSQIFDLDPFVVNLADTQEIRYLKVTMKLDLTAPEVSKEITGHLPEIRDNLLMLLSSKDLAGVQALEGKMQLRDEIIQRINGILKAPKVKTVYFTEFVAQ